MKSQKILSLDAEIIEELKNIPNASKLINEMLKDYFNKSGHLKKQELKNKLILIEADIKRFTNDMELIKKQIETIEKDESRIRTIFKNIPSEILEDIKFFDKMTLDTLLNRFNQFYKRKYEIKWEEVKKAFCELKGIKSADGKRADGDSADGE